MSNEFHPSLHSASRHKDGRTFGRYHNDREGETFSDECHVVPELSKDNIYYNVIDDVYYTHDDAQNGSYTSFKDAEDTFIKDALKDAYEAQQERHRAHRQYNRCKSIDDWYEDNRKSGKITVDQVWMQIGNYDDGSVDKDTLYSVVVDYLQQQQDYDRKHNIDCVILDVAIHVDERVNGVITPHAHINRIFFGRDKDGRRIAGQEACFNQSDLLRPDESKKVSHYNNRKMTYTKDSREIYLNVCEAHSIPISREPLPDGNKRHKELDSYITQQNRRKKQETAEAEKRAQKAEERAKQALNEAEQAKQALDAMRAQMQAMQAQIDMLTRAGEDIDEENKKKLSRSERVVFEFGCKMSKEHAWEWQQFLDDKYDDATSSLDTSKDFEL